MNELYLTEKHKDKIRSILSQHLLLFGKGIISYNNEVINKTYSLLESLDSIRENDTGALISIIQLHSYIFGYGIVNSNRSVIREDKELIYLIRKLFEIKEIPRIERGSFRRSRFHLPKRKIERNVRSNGLPMFGLNKVSLDFIENGFSIIFSLNKDETLDHFIHIIPPSELKSVRYSGKKTLIVSTDNISTIIITKNEIKKSFVSSFGVENNLEDFFKVRVNNDFNIYISGKYIMNNSKQENTLICNPEEGKYSFYFPLGKNSFLHISLFIKEVIKRITKISERDANNISYFVTKKIFNMNDIPITMKY